MNLEHLNRAELPVIENALEGLRDRIYDFLIIVDRDRETLWVSAAYIREELDIVPSSLIRFWRNELQRERLILSDGYERRTYYNVADYNAGMLRVSERNMGKWGRPYACTRPIETGDVRQDNTAFLSLLLLAMH